MQKKKNHYDYENNKIWENDLPCHVNLISHHHDVFLIVFYISLFHVIISIVGILWKTWIPADQTLFRGQTSAECLPENLQWKIWTERLHCNCHFLIAVSKRWMVNLKPFFLGGGAFFIYWKINLVSRITIRKILESGTIFYDVMWSILIVFHFN